MEVEFDLDPLEFCPPGSPFKFTALSSVRLQLPNGWPFISRDHLLRQAQAGTPWFTATDTFGLEVKSATDDKLPDVLPIVQSSYIWKYLELELQHTELPSHFNVQKERPISLSILPPAEPFGIFCSLTLGFHMYCGSIEAAPRSHHLSHHPERSVINLDEECKSIFATDAARSWVDMALATLIGAWKQPMKASVTLAEIAPAIFNPKYREVMAQRAPLIQRLAAILAQPIEVSADKPSEEADEQPDAQTMRKLAHSGIWRLVHQHAIPQRNKTPLFSRGEPDTTVYVNYNTNQPISANIIDSKVHDPGSTAQATNVHGNISRPSQQMPAPDKSGTSIQRQRRRGSRILPTRASRPQGL